MSERKEITKPIPICCFTTHDDVIPQVQCWRPASWRIRHGPDTDSYTESCTAHVGAMLTDATEHRIYHIENPPLRGAGIEWKQPYIHIEDVKESLEEAVKDSEAKKKDNGGYIQ